MKRLVAHCLLVLLLVSCGGKEPGLRKAAALVEEHPDSALYVLDGVSRSALASGREQAEYDYLSAYAFYRNYYFLDDASEAALERACLYFEGHGPAVERMRAWELMGTVQTATNRYGSGLVSFRKAEAVALSIERARVRTGMSALLLVAVLATLVLYFWARRNQTQRLLLETRTENERMMSIAEDLRSKVAALGTRSADKKPVPGLDMLDRLCEQYYVFEGTSNLQPRILGEVRSIVEGLRSDPKVQRNLELSLNASSDDVMKRLRTAFPRWKDEDFLLYCFTASGFSSTTISTLLEKDKPYVYNRIYRLKERIKASPSPDRDFFLACLEK